MYRSVCLSLLAGMVLLLAACSGPEPTEAIAVPEAGEAGQPAVASQKPTEKPAPGSNLVCEDPAPVEIGAGIPVSGAINDTHWSLCFWVELPAGLSSATFHLDGLEANLDLAVGYGFVQVLQYAFGEYWRGGESGTAPEAIVMENPVAGPYYIRIGPAGLKDPSSFTLSVTTEPETTADVTGAPLPGDERCERPAQEFELGESVQGEITDRGDGPRSRDYYCIQIPDGLSTVTIDLTGLSGFLEIFVRHEVPAEWMDRGRQGEARSVTIENPAPGPYYIDVAVAMDGSSSPYTLTVRGQ